MKVSDTNSPQLCHTASTACLLNRLCLTVSPVATHRPEETHWKLSTMQKRRHWRCCPVNEPLLLDGPSANAVMQWLKWPVRSGAVGPQPDRVQPHLSQQGAVQWLILSFALCHFEYLLIIALAVEFRPCVHTAEPFVLPPSLCLGVEAAARCQSDQARAPLSQTQRWHFLPGSHFFWQPSSTSPSRWCSIRLPPSTPFRLITAVSSRVPFHLEPNFL